MSQEPQRVEIVNPINLGLCIGIGLTVWSALLALGFVVLAVIFGGTGGAP